MGMLEIWMLHFPGGDSGQSHFLVESVLRVVHGSRKWVVIFLALFLERNFKEVEETEGGGQGELEKIPSPQRETLQGV